MSKTYDIFFSHAWKDNDALAPLLEALRATGLQVWFDQSNIEEFSGISRSVADGLANSRAMLAFYSRTYPTRRACQWELTAAYIAAQRLGEPRQRVLVVNPERDSFDHIQPTSLRDSLLPSFPDPGDVDAMRALAESIRDHVVGLDGTLGGVGPMVQPRWHPIAAIQSPRFVGRVPDLWAIHSTLHAAEYPLTTGQHTRVVFVSGFGGIGKTLLAEEYALRFGAAYPGGVFWLRAFGGDPERADLGPEMREAERDRQIREIARSLGLTVENLPLTQVRGMIAGELQRAGKPAVWVVDDMPEGISSDEVRNWLAPHPFAATLVTTRSREYGGLGTVLQPGVLPADEAYSLLTFQRKPAGEAEEDAAREIVAELGSHALAVEIAGAALDYSRDRSFAEFLADLRDSTYDELALAAELAPVLPTDRKDGIVAMLARSIAGLSPDARRVLAIASMLPPAPIPDSIIVDTLAQTQIGEEPANAKHRGRKALAETDRRSLTERVGADTRIVHPLIVRTLRVRRIADELEVLHENELRNALCRSICDQIEILNSYRATDADSPVIPHAQALVQKVQDDTDARLATQLAIHSTRLGRYANASDIFRKLVAYSSSTFGPEASDTLTFMNDLAVASYEQGDTLSARAILEKVLEIRTRVLGEEHPDTLTSKNNLSAVRGWLGDLQNARDLAQEVFETRRRVLGEEHPDTLNSLDNLASRLADVGDRANARILAQKALDLRRKILGDDNPATIASMINVAVCFAEEGEHASAKELEERALESSRRIMGDEHPDTLTIRHNLANRYAELGDPAAAKELTEQVIAIRRRILGEEHPDTLATFQNLANRLWNSGDLNGARELQARVVGMCHRVLGGVHLYTLHGMRNLAVLEGAAGNTEQGRLLAQSALEGYLSIFGPEHPTTKATEKLLQKLAGKA